MIDEFAQEQTSTLRFRREVTDLTGFGQEQDKERARRAGFDAHLTKPADEAALARLFAYPAQ